VRGLARRNLQPNYNAYRWKWKWGQQAADDVEESSGYAGINVCSSSVPASP
jgi:hypothetical protein